MPGDPRRGLGKTGEELAARALVERGYAIVARNWRCPLGELDIIARDGDCLVFVEVKTRTGDGFGGLPEAVTADKVRRIRRLASLWLMQQEKRWPALRLDVIGVRLQPQKTEIRHLKGVG